MSLHRQDFRAQLGTLSGIVFDFTEVGDRMAKHRHTAHDSHISIVTSGKLLARVTGYPDMILEAGRVVDWPGGTEHEWEALEAPARLVNIFKPAR